MSNKFNNLQMQTIDQHIAGIKICDLPSDGWISAVRKALGMNVRQLAKRMGIAQQSASKFEKNELDGSITIRSLRKAAEAMDCKFVYAIIPKNGKLEDIARKQATKKATEIIAPVSHSMMLEAQEVKNIKEKIEEFSDEILKNINSKLWQ